MTITIRCGLRETSRTFTAPPTVAELKNDRNLKMELGFGDNVNVLINGVAQPDHVTIPPVSLVSIETAANTKAELVCI